MVAGSVGQMLSNRTSTEGDGCIRKRPQIGARRDPNSQIANGRWQMAGGRNSPAGMPALPVKCGKSAFRRRCTLARQVAAVRRGQLGRFGSPVLPGLAFHISYFTFQTRRSGRGWCARGAEGCDTHRPYIIRIVRRAFLPFGGEILREISSLPGGKWHGTSADGRVSRD
jgi:hypothetical protein